MASYETIKRINSLKQDFLTTSDLKSLLEIASQKTFEGNVKRLLENKVIIQLEKGKYQIASKSPSDFEIAQFLYNPSYVSFETALNYHGILSQFPYETISATAKKRTQKIVDQKVYSYIHIDKALFTGYESKDNALIATPEKAIFDQVYLSTRGLRSLNAIDEMDFSNISKEKILEFTNLVSENKKKQIHKILNRYLQNND